MMAMGDKRIARGWLGMGLSLLLPACTTPVRSFGTLATVPAERTFSMAGDGAADVAVRDALLASGYRSSPDGHYRVEVSMAVRMPKVDVMTAPGEGQDMRPVAPVSNPPGLCRRQSYVLSIALIDRMSGRVTSRGGAVTSPCGEPTFATLLPLLAKAALAKDS